MGCQRSCTAFMVNVLTLNTVLSGRLGSGKPGPFTGERK